MHDLKPSCEEKFHSVQVVVSILPTCIPMLLQLLEFYNRNSQAFRGPDRNCSDFLMQGAMIVRFEDSSLVLCVFIATCEKNVPESSF